jgi:hypothetical protein
MLRFLLKPMDEATEPTCSIELFGVDIPIITEGAGDEALAMVTAIEEDREGVEEVSRMVEVDTGETGTTDLSGQRERLNPMYLTLMRETQGRDAAAAVDRVDITTHTLTTRLISVHTVVPMPPHLLLT